MRGKTVLIRCAMAALACFGALLASEAAAGEGRWLLRPSDGVWEWHEGNPAVLGDLDGDGWATPTDLALLLELLREPAPRLTSAREGDRPRDVRRRADGDGNGLIDERDVEVMVKILGGGEPAGRGLCEPACCCDQVISPTCPCYGKGGNGDGPAGISPPQGGPSPGGGGGPGPGGPDCKFSLKVGCDPGASPLPEGIGSVRIRAEKDGQAVSVSFLAPEGVTVEAGGCGYVVTAEEPGTYLIRARRQVDGRTCDRWIAVTILELDLDIDSDNDNGFDVPDRSMQEDEIEEEGGIKVLIVNRGDADRDGVPDYADGFGAHGGVSASRFVPIQLNLDRLHERDGAEVVFSYSASDPAGVAVVEIPVPDLETSYTSYTRPSGHLRLWRKEGAAQRSLDDFVASDAAIGVDDIPETLYVEAVGGSSIALTITATLTLGTGETSQDSVQVLPLDSLSGLSEQEIVGFTIIQGGGMGTPGNDIIFGTDGDDIIVGGDGDDIIVAGDGDDYIDAGAGSDVVFAYLGHNDTTMEPGTQTLLGRGQSEEQVIPDIDGPLTSEAVIRAYKQIYGDGDLWYETYVQMGGRVECVKDDGRLFSVSSWDRKRRESHSHFEGPYEYVIQLEFELEKPYKAAAHMRQQLLDIADASATFQILHASRLQESIVHEWGDDEAIQTYDEARLAAFQRAVETTSLIASLYADSVGILSVGADLVLAINDVSEGEYLSAVAFLPFVPKTMVENGARVIVRGFDGIVLAVKRGRVVVLEGANPPNMTTEIGYIARTNMPHAEIPNPSGRPTILLGTAQTVEEGAGETMHRLTVARLAHEAGKTGEYEYIVMNRSLKTATGGLSADNRFPDITLVRRDGRVEMVEVRSNGQTAAELELKLEQMLETLPPERRGTSRVENMDPQP